MTGAAVARVPHPRVLVDGTPWAPALAAGLGRVRVRQEASAPAVCELEFDLRPDATPPAAGSALTLALDDAVDPLFSGEVHAVEHVLGPTGARVRLRCQDLAHRLRDRCSAVAHTDVTVADLARRLAGDAGLGVDAAAEGPRWARVVQAGETDLAFLGRLAAAAALWWQVSGEVLHLREWAADAPRTATWGRELLEAVVTEEAAPATGVRSLGWDPVTRATVAGSWPGQGGADAVVLDGVLPDPAHAASGARARVERAGAERLRLRAVLAGDPAWRPGVGLRVGGAPGVPEGPFLLTSVEHVVDAASGYLCVVASAPPPDPAAPRPGATGFSRAEVIAVDDPEQAGRVRCAFAAWGGLESEWLPVVTAGAGAGKGLVCQPDVGDVVVVLYALDDPGRGVVLGGLFADSVPLEAAGVAGGGVRHVAWTTPDGQSLRLDRDGDVAAVANAAGSGLRLAAEGVALHAAADLVIEAPGRRIVLRADAIDFERG